MTIACTLPWAITGCVEDLTETISNLEDAINVVPGPGSKVIDDFDACDAKSSSIETYWYTYNDNSEPNNGTSTGEKSNIREGYAQSKCSLHWEGKVTTAFEYGFSGLGLDVLPVDMSAHEKMVIVLRGDGRSYRIKFPLSTQVGESDHFGINVKCGDGTDTWKKLEFDLLDIEQEGWGVKRDLELDKILQLQIQTTGQPISAFNCDLGLVYVE